MKEVLLFVSALAVGVSGWFLRGFAEKYNFDVFRFKRKTPHIGLDSKGNDTALHRSIDLREAPSPSIRVSKPEMQESTVLARNEDENSSKSQGVGDVEMESEAVSSFLEAKNGPVGEERVSFSAMDLGLIDPGREQVDFEGTDFFYEDRTLPEAGDSDLDDYAQRLDELGKMLVAHFSNQVENVRVDLLNEVKVWLTQHGAFDQNIVNVAEASARKATEVLEVASLQENRHTFVQMYNQVMQDQYPRDEKGRFTARSKG